MEKQEWMAAAEKFEQIRLTWDIPPHIEKGLLLDICKCAGKLKDRSWVHRACGRSIEKDEQWIDSRIAYAEILTETSETTEQWEETVRAWRSALDLDQNNGQIHEGLRRAETALKQSKTKNYYKILSVSRNAEKSEIKRAYRDLAKQYHPDRHQGIDEEELKELQKKFSDIAEAYEVLSDDELRGKYDRGEQVFENQGQQQQHNPFSRRGHGGFQWSFNF